MKVTFNDYDGPTGLFVATGSEVLPLTTPAGAAAFAASGAQAGTIDPELGAAIQAAAESAGASITKLTAS